MFLSIDKNISITINTIISIFTVYIIIIFIIIIFIIIKRVKINITLLRLLEKQNALHLPVFSIFFLTTAFPEYQGIRYKKSRYNSIICWYKRINSNCPEKKQLSSFRKHELIIYFYQLLALISIVDNFQYIMFMITNLMKPCMGKLILNWKLDWK